MKYRITITQISVDDFRWNVFETETERVVETHFFEEDAVARAKFMENGGAFSGFTPSFMLNSVLIPSKSVNDTFKRMFY